MEVKSKLAQIAYAHRSQVPKKFIKSRVLNTFGLQVLRTTSAHFLHRLRSAPNLCRPSPYIGPLLENGITVIPNFLDKIAFDEVLHEYKDVFQTSSAGNFRVDQKGSSIVKFFPIFSTAEDQQRFPAITKGILRNQELVDIFTAAERRKKISIDFCELQQLTCETNSEEFVPDYESFLHQDTFFPTFKAWLYLEDVGSEDGPLVYVPGSHKVTMQRLAFEFKKSIAALEEGSWRITDESLEKQCKKPMTFECKANTLVVANTYGFHARRQIQPPKVRKAIHISIRLNPWSLMWFI